MKNPKLIVGLVIVLCAFAGGWLWAGRTPAPAAADTQAVAAGAADGAKMVMYQNPACGCCGLWVAHMEEAGFEVEVNPTPELNRIKEENGITAETAGCHTAFVDGYIVEGHVPARDVIRMLQERPDIAGITVPGMPMGSPGMEGSYSDRYDVLTFDDEGKTTVYASY